MDEAALDDGDVGESSTAELSGDCHWPVAARIRLHASLEACHRKVRFFANPQNSIQEKIRSRLIESTLITETAETIL